MLTHVKKIQEKIEKIQNEANDEKKLSYSVFVALSVFVLLLPVLLFSSSFSFNLAVDNKASQTANIVNSNTDAKLLQEQNAQQENVEPNKTNYKVLRIEI